MAERARDLEPLRGDRPYFTDDLLYRAATLYYSEDATQAEIASRLGLSRPTVSRMLAEARSRGLVRIEVRRPQRLDTDAIADQVRQALGLKRVWVSPDSQGEPPGAALARQVRLALGEAEVGTGDGVLVSPGRTIWEISHYPMPSLPGAIVAPTAGGMDEPEAYYQTNEITRLFAANTGGQPWFLYAPAMPGPDLYDLLLREPTLQRVFDLWGRARVALLGVGAPLTSRKSHPSVLPKHLPAMAASVGDICLRPYNRLGEEIPFPGSNHLVSMELESLGRLDWAIAVATGPIKAMSIIAGARGGHLNCLVTDSETATAILDELAEGSPG
jgi:DNA-binding transcriptional regulator LsrR (DeoR family)